MGVEWPLGSGEPPHSPRRKPGKFAACAWFANGEQRILDFLRNDLKRARRWMDESEWTRLAVGEPVSPNVSKVSPTRHHPAKMPPMANKPLRVHPVTRRPAAIKRPPGRRPSTSGRTCAYFSALVRLVSATETHFLPMAGALRGPEQVNVIGSQQVSRDQWLRPLGLQFPAPADSKLPTKAVCTQKAGGGAARWRDSRG